MRYFMLRKRTVFILAAAVFLLAGCVPQTSEEFRKMIGGAGSSHILTTYETLEVARPFKDVTATLRKKSDQCLNGTVHLYCSNCIVRSEVRKTLWRTTFIAGGDHTEVDLHLYEFVRPDFDETKGKLSGANYEIVLDAVPAGKNRTKVDIYRRRPNMKFVDIAMQGWVKGDNMGCPDLTTFH